MRDDDLARWFAERRTPTLDTVAEVGTFLGDTLAGIVVLLLLGVGFSLWRRTWLPLAFVTVGYVGLLGVYLVATQLVPGTGRRVEILDKGLVPDHSFPSGHTMTSTGGRVDPAAAALDVHRVPRAATLALVAVPVFTLLARMYQGAHHLTDVLTALVFAVVWLSVVTGVLFAAPAGVDARPGTRSAVMRAGPGGGTTRRCPRPARARSSRRRARRGCCPGARRRTPARGAGAARRR